MMKIWKKKEDLVQFYDKYIIKVLQKEQLNPLNEKFLGHFIPAFLDLSQIWRDTSAAQLACSLDEKLYIEYCSKDLTKNFHVYEPLYEMYVAQMVAPIKQLNYFKSISNSFPQNGQETIKRIISEMKSREILNNEEVISNSKKKKIQLILNDDTFYYIYEGNTKYYEKITANSYDEYNVQWLTTPILLVE